MKALVEKPFYGHTDGLDQSSPLTAMPDKAAYDLLNVEGDETGLISSRPGQAVFCRMTNAPKKFFDYRNEAGTQRILAFANTGLYNITSGTEVVVSAAVIDAGRIPGVTKHNDRVIFGDGVNSNKKYNGTNLWDQNIPDPIADVSLNTAVAGAITYTVGSRYLIVFVNSVTNEKSNPFHVDDPQNAPTTGAITAKRVDVTRPAVPGSDPQVDRWWIYKTDDGGGTFKFHADVPIGTNPYQDNVQIPATNDILEFDNDPAPISQIFAEFRGSLVLVPEDDPSHIRLSKPGISNAFPLSLDVLVGGDGDPIVSLRSENKLLWIEKRDSTWILPDHTLNGGVPFKVADKGGLHKDSSCIYGQNLMSMSQTGYIYNYPPTEFSYDEIRYKLRGYNIKRILDVISKQSISGVRCINYESKTKNQIWFAVPYGQGILVNNIVLVFDPILAAMNKRKESWWVFQFNHDVKAMSTALINGDSQVLIGDSNGVVYNYPDGNGDGAEENGTVTSATPTTLVDSTQTWTVNEFANLYVWIVAGTGAGQKVRILSNTSNTLTMATTWAVTPDATSEYSIGGYDKKYYTNWKNYGREALRKRFRFVRVVARQGGDYDIDVIFKKDFQLSESLQRVVPFNISNGNSIWGVMMWGIDPWGQNTVARGRIKFHSKFNSIQIGFRNRKAGQPFQIEGFTTFHQGLTVRTRQ